MASRASIGNLSDFARTIDAPVVGTIITRIIANFRDEEVARWAANFSRRRTTIKLFVRSESLIGEPTGWIAILLSLSCVEIFITSNYWKTEDNFLFYEASGQSSNRRPKVRLFSLSIGRESIVKVSSISNNSSCLFRLQRVTLLREIVPVRVPGADGEVKRERERMRERGESGGVRSVPWT